jgi:hypothetical protein
MKLSVQTLQTITLFAILFILIGLFAPMVYVQVSPANSFLDVHSFTADDTHVGADEHNIYLDRTVTRPAEGDVTIELKLLRDDGAIVEEDSFSVDAYFQKGRQQIVIPRKIQDDVTLEPGTYKYVNAVELTYYGGLITKNIIYESEEFHIYENKTALTNSTKAR